MKTKSLVTSIFAFVLGLGWSFAWAAPLFPNNPMFDTIFISVPSGIEGLTGRDGNLYVADRGIGDSRANCKVWKTDPNSMPGDEVQVGQITGGCRPSGLTFDASGNLFITSSVGIYKLFPAVGVPPTAIAAAPSIIGVQGNNGVAFDAHGNLWISDGTSNVGRV